MVRVHIYNILVITKNYFTELTKTLENNYRNSWDQD